ncbi:MAG: helicase-related protein [Gemmatimonadaceae bacterium]|jgi:hypothetical protein
MSYLPVPRVATEQAGTPAAEEAIQALLGDLAERKEFAALRPRAAAPERVDVAGFVREAAPAPLFLPGHRLHGAQLFVSNFESPNTEYTRLLIEWQTGTGKSLAAIAIAHEFIRQWRRRAALGELRSPTVFVISFTARETIQRDMLRYPEFGFASAGEVEELRRLEAADAAAGPAGVAESRQLASFLGVLRRRITDRGRGGYYQFYGYKEFANRLITVTRRGEERAVTVLDLYAATSAATGAATDAATGTQAAESTFGERLAAAVKRGDVVVNEELLEEMRGGLLIADEIHNTYNINEPNNYGIAIQYALDALGDEAPRAIFMSATPETGSAAEVVDLLNLVVPRSALPDGVPLRRSDFFARAATRADDDEPEEAAARAAVVSQLREGALDRIGHLFAGRVSFLLDSDVGSYPRRVFVGEPQPGVPYLSLTACPMSPFHERTLDATVGGGARGLAADSASLYDMAFPNPDSAEVGLYKSVETPAKLARAPEDWRMTAGVIVEREGNTTLVSGPFLALGRLAEYSTKFDRLVRDVVEAIRAGPGKIMIYHHRVRMSGVLLIQEALRMNGIADEASSPTDATLCAVCGVARRAHAAEASAAHEYAPARFVVAHSDIDRAAMIRSINRYNAPANLAGQQYRVLIGSKIIRESYNFRAVRHLLITSFPTDYPTLIQIVGRVVRKNSHIEFPESQREVRIRIYVSTRAGGGVSPELQRYVDKGGEFLVIQEVARARHRYAVDGFANYQRVRAAMGVGPGGELRPNLDGLPYSPVVPAAAATMRTATFESYGHGEREVSLLMSIARSLFRTRPVWTYDDLWAAVRRGAGAARVGVDYATFDEGNFALALAGLARPAGDPLVAVARAGRYYVAARVGDDGAPVLDVESYVREAHAPPRRAVRIADYLRDSRSGQNFAVRLREFAQRYLDPGGTPIEFALVEYGAPFHYALLRRLVVETAPVTSNDALLRRLYRRFHIAVTPTKASNEIVGYVASDFVTLYDRATSTWRNASLSEYGIGRRHAENDIVVGFVVSETTDSDTDVFAAASARAKFKLRLPVQKLRARAGQSSDARLLARGAVCETHPREELRAYAARLRGSLTRQGGGPSPARAAELCDTIREYLLALEENARSASMSDSPRYLYLFNDRPPTLTGSRN